MVFELMDTYSQNAVIKVIGVGGGGGNAVEHMLAGNIEGVEFIMNYDVYIHPRCKHTIDEFMHYSYKIDPLTGNVTPMLIDNHNHIIDAIRYALEDVRHRKGKAMVV